MKEHLNMENLSFEEAVEEIEKIILNLERGEIPLNESIDKFEKGIELYKYCNNLLNRYEGKIKKIVEDIDGDVIEENFEF
ncbi:exodeoxyribonuclease VII small subunit [Clostridiisalibacter paucivorans]|uniref:exodeoxyribonuclease VII small subunit n=1 Tax=Clostridiisalibacter paucivorans TaxID=408753 RepID=UPI000686C9BA|nr:exodeoxyribonuclease VII small subunit [Clostridiisalibacter paucivorans]